MEQEAACEVGTLNSDSVVMGKHAIPSLFIHSRWIQNALCGAADFERGLLTLSALTEKSTEELEQKFTSWIRTKPFSWQTGMEMCLSEARCGFPLPFDEVVT